MDEWIDGCTCTNGWMEVLMDGQMNVLIDGQVGCTIGWMDGWMNGWMDGWMDGQMDGWMDGMDGWNGQMDGWIDGCTNGWIDRQMDGMDILSGLSSGRLHIYCISFSTACNCSVSLNDRAKLTKNRLSRIVSLGVYNRINFPCLICTTCVQ